MKKLLNLSLIVFFTAIISSCGNSGKQKNESLGDKKAELQKLKTQKEKLDEQVATLEKDIAKLDTSAAVAAKPKLVALTTVKTEDFKHYLDLQGSVDAKNISYITPSGQGGQIKAIYVKQGDKVHKGQLILKLDDAIARENVNAVKQQLGSVQAQLDLAKSVYQRQSNLWAQHIGTEVQLLQAKTNVETLQNQLKAIQAQVATAQEQANQSNVYSNVNGTVDDITAHVGETFNGNPLTGGYIKIVNDTDLKITVTVPENYSGQVKKGTKVIVKILDINKTFDSEISFISQAIGATTRGFTAEIKVPKGMNLRPNQIAQVSILDYSAPNSIAIPVNTLQTGENGKFVLVAAKEGDKMVAKKRDVVIGQLYGDNIEVKSGLQPGDQLITDGFQGLFDGQPITTNAE
ncbi:MAG TPA: efflux RND transporter periplasmic adaptor subunit [Hanamia sp.]|jgi:membrane fusion protein, multidrug efflux system|nr:efflux RND transporter periplasmic adaptor subunit [Hanamia sp.]